MFKTKKNYGLTFIQDDNFLSLISSVSSIVNIFSRFFWGFVSDHLSFKVYINITNLIFE
jgi:hypothetical protein